MKIAEMLRRGGVLVPLDAPDLEWALTGTLRAVTGMSNEGAKNLARDIATGVSGELHRVHDRVIVALAESDVVEEICAVIGVSPSRFSKVEMESPSGVAPDEADAGLAPGSESEMILVLLTPGRVVSLRERTLPTLRRFFQEAERIAPLLNARSIDGVTRVAAFMELDPHRSLLVEDVVEPVRYRVYPDTPYSEVADLMVRRGLQAVPVVGEDYEFLGVITAGDAMDELVSQARTESAGGGSS